VERVVPDALVWKPPNPEISHKKHKKRKKDPVEHQLLRLRCLLWQYGLGNPRLAQEKEETEGTETIRFDH